MTTRPSFLPLLLALTVWLGVGPRGLFAQAVPISARPWNCSDPVAPTIANAQSRSQIRRTLAVYPYKTNAHGVYEAPHCPPGATRPPSRPLDSALASLMASF